MPRLHVFLFKIAASVFEKLGDPNWVIALSAVITAFFTGILGYFTVSLARSTRIAANAAEKAVIEIERPWLFLEGATVRPRDPRTMTIIQNNWYIKLHWKNLGRSPAIVTDCIFKLIEFSTVGPEPDYTGALPLTLQRTIGVGESVPTNEVGPARKSTEGVEGPELIFFGRLTYSELNGKIHNTGFALRVAAAIPAYARYENKDYDYYD
jgi:hypothetical protein